MQVSDKPFVRKFVEMLPNLETKSKEHETLDNLIRQTFVSDSLSFTKVGESPVQWIHWLDTIDQQNTIKSLKNSKLEAGLDSKDSRLQEILVSNHMKEVSSLKDSIHSSGKGSNMFGRGLQTSGDRLHSLKFPEAMVAFAQAAAKANDLPGWPLMSNKVQVQKCEKCSLEFYSTLNQRRHMRATHRRPLNVDKEDLKKKKEQVAAYWDKLNPEEACEVVSFKNISLPDLSAASVVRALSAHSQQPGLLSLPQSYVKVATALLDLVQNKPSNFPISSEELLSILEDASEKNLLYGVTSSSMQRCIFDNEPGRVGLEAKNLVASLGFLVELRLVKAWMEDKDVEALRCQKVLVEEEEAAQKKRAKIQERKRQKKMRQKESKDKERKESESSCGLQRLKLDLFSGENCTRHGEGEDSPTVTQSSPSSSGYSGQDLNHLETSHLDLNEFEGGDNDKADSENDMLANEPPEFLCDLSDEHHGAPNLFHSTTSEQQAGVSKSSGGANTLHVGSLISDRDSNLQSSSHGGSQDSMAQNGVSDHKWENERSSMQFRTLNGKFVSERKIGGQGWRERRQHEVNDFLTYQRQPYNYDRRYYDYSYGSQRGLRKPYVAGNCTPELSGSMVSKINATPQYGQYREKYSGIKRANAGSGHAVWTRKAPQNSAPESDQPHEQSSSAVSMNCTGEALSDTCLASVEKLSGGSSVSFDSVIPHAPNIAPARIESEKEVNFEEPRVSQMISTRVFSDPMADLELADCAGTGEPSNASGAVFIGSLQILLGDISSNPLDCISSSGNSQEALNCLSEDVKDLPGKNSEVSESDTRAGTVDLGSSGAGATLKGSLNSLQESRTPPPDVLKESHSNASFRHTVAGDQSYRHVEKLVKLIPGSNGFNKLGMTKVWRPIIGERNDSLMAGSLSAREEVGEMRIDIIDKSDVLPDREVQGAGSPDTSLNHLQPCLENSDDNSSNICCTGNIQNKNDQEAADCSCFEGPYNSSFKSDSFEMDASRREFFDQPCTAGYMSRSLGEEVYESPPMFPYLASFLSQRWADAIACVESVDMAMQLRESDDFFVKSVTCSLSPPFSDDSISSHQLQDEEEAMHKVDLHCKSCAEW